MNTPKEIQNYFNRCYTEAAEIFDGLMALVSRGEQLPEGWAEDEAFTC